MRISTYSTVYEYTKNGLPLMKIHKLCVVDQNNYSINAAINMNPFEFRFAILRNGVSV